MCTHNVNSGSKAELVKQYQTLSTIFEWVLSSFFQILSANEQACKLFECTTNELIGKKLSSILKTTSQVLEKALEEDFLLVDGTVGAVSGKVVWNILTNNLQNENDHTLSSWIFFKSGLYQFSFTTTARICLFMSENLFCMFTMLFFFFVSRWMLWHQPEKCQCQCVAADSQMRNTGLSWLKLWKGYHPFFLFLKM